MGNVAWCFPAGHFGSEGWSSSYPFDCSCGGAIDIPEFPGVDSDTSDTRATPDLDSPMADIKEKLYGSVVIPIILIRWSAFLVVAAPRLSL